MNMIIHVDKEYEDELLDLGLPYSQSTFDCNAFIVTIPLESDDETLVESLHQDELVEFFGLSSEGVVYTEIQE